MKFVIFALAVVALLYLLKSSRRRVPPPESKPAAPSPATQVQDMVACAHCGLHLPRDEALPGRGGVFCGEAHRAAHEKDTPRA